jgi:hypothetical protein
MAKRQFGNSGRYEKRSYRKKKKEGDVNAKKCPHCGSNMKCKGPGDTAGAVYWKCKDKRCGRTLWVRKPAPKEIVPLTYDRKY